MDAGGLDTGVAKLPASREDETARDDEFLVIHEESDEGEILMTGRRFSDERQLLNEHYRDRDSAPVQQHTASNDSESEPAGSGDEVILEAGVDDDDSAVDLDEQMLFPVRSAAPPRRYTGLPTSEALSRLERNIHRNLEAYVEGTKLKWFWDAFHPASTHAIFTWTGFAVIFAEFLIVGIALTIGEFNKTLIPESEVIALLGMLFVFMMLNFGLNAWHAHARHFEMYRKVKLLEKRINYARRIGRWSLVFYDSLDAPDSPCISLQWTYRDNCVVNLPSCMLVEGDVILVRPAQQVFARCQELKSEDGSLGDFILEPGDVYLPKPSSTADTSTNSVSGGGGSVDGSSTANIIRLVNPVTAAKFRVLLSPIHGILQQALNMHQRENPRPRSVFENERNKAWRLIERIVIPAAIVLNLIVSLIRHFTEPHQQREPFVEQFVLSFVVVILPLTPLVFPVFYILANYVGLARVLSLLSRFRRKKHKIEMLAESRVTDTYFFAEVHWPTVWRKFKALVTGRDDESLHRTANFMQTLANVSAICCVDKKGILSWANPNAEKVFFIRNHHRDYNPSAILDVISAQLKAKLDYNALRQRIWSGAGRTNNNNAGRRVSIENSAPTLHGGKMLRTNKSGTNYRKHSNTPEQHQRGVGAVLDLAQSGNEPFAMHFNGGGWRKHLDSLKPLGLAILLNTCVENSTRFYRMFADHLAYVANSTCPSTSVSVLNRRCLCMLSQTIGFVPAEFHKHYRLVFRFGVYRKPPPDEHQHQHQRKPRTTVFNFVADDREDRALQLRQSVRSSSRPSSAKVTHHVAPAVVDDVEAVKPSSSFIVGDDDSSPYQSMPLTPAHAPAVPLSPSHIATVMNETQEMTGNYKNAVSLVDAVRLARATNRRRDSCQSDDNNSSSLKTHGKDRPKPPSLSPTYAGNDEEATFHSCRSSSISSLPSNQLLVNGDEADADDENDEAASVQSEGASSRRSYNMQAADQVYKTPFPNCYVTVVQDRLSGLCHVVVQGTGDMLADIVAYYWNGVEMKPFSEAERVRIRDFYTRQSLTAYASAFAYKSLANAAKLANILDERCNAGLDDTTNTSGLSTKGDLIFELPNIMPTSASSPASYMEQILRATRSAGGLSALDADILEACLSDLIFVGETMFQYQSRNSFVHTIELLQQGCIRFIHFSRENELRSRAFAERLGLESGWNCHVCLDSEAVDPHAATTLLEHEVAQPPRTTTTVPINTIQILQPTPTSPPSSPVNAVPPVETTKHNRQRRSTNVSKVSNVSDLQPPQQQQQPHRSSVTSSTTHRSTRQQVTKPAAAAGNPGFSLNPKGNVANVAGVRSPGGDSVSISESTSAQDSTDQNVMPNFDWYNRSGLPKGIENIREHLDKIDNVPLLVPLFTDCKQTSAQEMIKIMQENGEVVCTIGSAASQWNASVFSQSDSAVAIEPLHAEHCAVRAYIMSAGVGRANAENNNDMLLMNDVDAEMRAAGDAANRKTKQPLNVAAAARHRLSNVRWSRSHEIPQYLNQSGGNSQNASTAQLNANVNVTPVHRVNFSTSSAVAGGNATSATASKLQPRTRQRNRQQQQQQPHQPTHKRMLRGGGGSSGSLAKTAVLMKDLRRRKSASGNNLMLTGKNAAAVGDSAGTTTGGSRRTSVDPALLPSSAATTGQQHLSVNRRVSMIAGALTAKPSALRSPFKKNSGSMPPGLRYQHLEHQQHRIQSPRYAEQARQMMKRKLQALHLPTASAGRRSPHRHHYSYHNLLNRSDAGSTSTKKPSRYDGSDAFLASAAARDLRTSPQDIANHINSLNCALKLHADEPFCLITLIMQSRHFMSVLRNCLLFMVSCQLFLFLTILLSRLVLMPYPLSLGQLMFIIFVIIPLLCVGIMASPQERQQMKYPTSKNHNLMRWPVVRRYLSSFARRWLPSLLVCCLLFVLLCLQHCQPTHEAVYAVDEALVRDNRSVADAVSTQNLSRSQRANDHTQNTQLFHVHNASGSFASCYPRLANIQSPDIVVSAAQLIVFFEICMCFVVTSASYLNPHHTICGRSPFRNRWWLFCAVVGIGLSVLFVIGDQGLYMLRTSSQSTDGFGIGALVWSDAWEEQASLGHDRKMAVAVQVFVWSATCVWPFVLLILNEVLKKQDIVRHEKRQKRARLQFNTKLGQYSPV